MTPQALQAALETAVARLRGGRAHDARALLEQIVQQEPKVAEAHRLLGLARRAVNDMAGAEAALIQAVALDRKNVEALVGLAEVQALRGQPDAAEKGFRAALALNRRNADAARGLSAVLSAKGRHTEALQATTPLYEGSNDAALIGQHGAALKALGRFEEAVKAQERVAALQPTSPVPEHNIAAALADLGRYAEAEAATKRAFDKGGRAPETWLVHAHALQGQDKLDEAEAAYRAAIRARPTYIDPHRDLAQLIWMRTEDVNAAAEALDAAIAASNDASLIAVKAKLLSEAGDEQRSYAVLAEAVARRPGDGALQLAASQQAVKAGLPAEALAHAERAITAFPGDFRAEVTLCEALLAGGLADRAAESAERLRRAKPDDQHALALQAMAWRMLGDPRYGALYDYAAFVRPYRIDTPEGWDSLDTYLADLAEGLRELHVLRTHPVGQSLRHGSQTNQSLLRSSNPAVKAFTQAVDGPIRRHITAIGQGKDPLRARNRGGYAIAGIWSVQLRPGGYHIDHVHPEGWLSSACYIALPKAVEGEGRQGWIGFGQPGIRTTPPLPAEHYVKPEPGLLVLFPSYMWHGTVPFTGDEPRLTVAFDLSPDKARR